MKAYELLAKPENWCQGHSAKNAKGEMTGPPTKDAVAWCPVRAIYYCYPEKAVPLLCRKIEQEVPTTVMGIGPWNDKSERTHAEVVELLRKLDI